MKHSAKYVMLATVVGLALATAGLSAGCQSDDENEPNNAAQGQGGNQNQGGQGGSAGDNTAGNAGNAGNAGSNVGGSGGNGDPECPAGQERTIAEIADGAVGPEVAVTIKRAIVTTNKILISRSKNTGSCLWGIFVKDPDQARGMMVVNYGDKAPTTSEGVGDCPENTDKIPADIKPGDVISFNGETSSYAPSNCGADGGTVPVKQVQIFNSCGFKVLESGAAPEPVVVNPNDLVTGDAKYQGLLVKIENVDAEDWPDGGTVGPYGIIRIANSDLEVHDKFYYKKSGDAPVFDPSQHFNSIVGISHLDYCDWVLQPRDKCNDFDPASKDCL